MLHFIKRMSYEPEQHYLFHKVLLQKIINQEDKNVFLNGLHQAQECCTNPQLSFKQVKISGTYPLLLLIANKLEMMSYVTHESTKKMRIVDAER